ncbi:MAG: methyl-accepting chemotaxis protein [Lachnospiraceae bacterium]|nr:methyl-accepting chemotaxis protein [Lachnospiraceae bacterium]
MFKDERMEKRLQKSFVMVTVMAAVAAIIALAALIIVSNRYSYALTQYGFSQGDIGNAMAAFADARSSTRTVIAYSNKELVSKNLTAHYDNKAKFQEYFEKMQDTLSTKHEEDAYKQLSQKMEEYWILDTEIIELGKSTVNMQNRSRAQEKAANELAPMYDEVYGELSDLMHVNVTQGNKLSSSLGTVSTIMIFVIIVIIAAVMAVSIKLGKNIASQISHGLNLVSDRMKSFAKGDLSSEFPDVGTKDEINDLAVVLKSVANNLSQIINDIDDEVDALAEGNFMIKLKNPNLFAGEFKGLKDGVERITDKFRDTLIQIEEASDQVDAGAGQLAESATALAEGATDQAGAVQELTATITNVTVAAEDTAKRVGAAYEEGLEYRKQAEHGSGEMNNLISAMERISDASRQIENIIAEIEDIASQTNLLSLNASIEAARAGEAGKGFAVVADQIGKLATDSAQSAVKTRELIHNALEEVSAGNVMTQRTKESLEEVINGIEFLSNSSKQASDTALAQADTMREIEKGIEQISSVVQSNSASAQETSATSEELAAQATSLKELIGQFILR